MIIEIVISVILFFIFLPIRLNFLFYINLLQNRGATALQIMAKSVLQDKFKIANGQLTAKNQRDKEKTIDLSKDDKSIIFIENFVGDIIHKLILNDTYIGIEIGKKDDAMTTALLSGTALMFVDLIFAQVFSRKSGSNHSVDSEPYFCKNKLILCLNSNFYIDIFATLWALLLAYFATKKRLKQLKMQENSNLEKVNS